MKVMSPELVPVGVAARAIGRPSIDLLRLVETGELHAVRIDGRVMVDPADVTRLDVGDSSR